MKIVAGLGNPGAKYETTRHNAGFLAVDRLIDEWKATGPSKVTEGEAWQATVAGEKVLLLKPQTYMNNSGRCVAPVVKFYKCAPSDLIVIYDELDLKSMQLRIKTGGGAGGHNGIKSIDQHLGAGMLGYHRVRLGIGRPGSVPNSASTSAADYVLQPFTDQELDQLDPLLQDVTKATELLVRGEVATAMNQFNRERG